MSRSVSVCFLTSSNFQSRSGGTQPEQTPERTKVTVVQPEQKQQASPAAADITFAFDCNKYLPIVDALQPKIDAAKRKQAEREAARAQDPELIMAAALAESMGLDPDAMDADALKALASSMM